MKHWFNSLIVIALTSFSNAFADDLFPDGSAREIAPLTELSSGTTIGGYALFEGGRSWRLISNKASSNNMNIRIGSAQMISPIGGNYFAEMYVMASMSGAPENGYFSADVCNAGTPHLYVVNRGAGKNDNCLTIDPYVSTVRDKGITTLAIKIRNSQSNWRLYDVRLLLNLSLMGFPNTSTNDWSEINLPSDPKKQQFLARVFAWAKQLQNSVNTAIAFSKPKDAFAEVPPIGTLFEAGAENSAAVAAQTTSPIINQTPSEALQRSIAIRWDGYSSLISGTATLTETGRKGLVKITLPKGDGECSGSYEVQSGLKGPWAISCTNGMTSTGTFETAASGKSTSGTGSDTKGNRVEFTIGSAN